MNLISDVTIFNFTGVYESEDFYKKIDNPRFVECRNIKGTDCLCDDQGEEAIRKLIENNKVPINGIHFIDNGNYHYMSYIFTSYITEPFNLIYFDNHPDMKPSMFGDILSCGSWVKKVLDTNKYVKKIIAVGVNEELLEQIEEDDRKKVTKVSSYFRNEFHETENDNENNSIDYKILELLNDDIPVYISIDKDVLSTKQLMTNWDQGIMSIGTLTTIIKRLFESKRILGMDVCGEISSDTECDQDVQLGNNSYFNSLITQIALSNIGKS